MFKTGKQRKAKRKESERTYAEANDEGLWARMQKEQEEQVKQWELWKSGRA